jgi:sortase (surface protein transpeptidase)
MITPFRKIEIVMVLFGCFAMVGGAYAQATVSTAHGARVAFTQNLTVGSNGSDVSALQNFLIAGGYLALATSTGHFGSLTASALGAWQTSVGVSPATGYFGSISRGKINASATANASASITTNATTSVAVNESGLPVRLVIPKLNVNAGFQDTGLKSDGTMEVPSNIYDAGWFTGSARPGAKGVAIVTGHVAQVRGGVVTKPGVFSNLDTLVVGDTLTVLDDKGSTSTFVVRAVRSYDPTADATDVFTSNDGGAHLNIITCEGTWDQALLSYTKRLVVFTDAVQ